MAEARRREAARRQAERALSDALPGFFSKADPARLRAAIDGARRAGVAEATVASAEARLERIEEEARRAMT